MAANSDHTNPAIRPYVVRIGGAHLSWMFYNDTRRKSDVVRDPGVFCCMHGDAANTGS